MGLLASCLFLAAAARADLERARQLSAESLGLYQAGRYDEARTAAEQTLAIRQAELDPPHVLLAEAHLALGVVLREQGDYAAARPHLEQALALYREASGPDHADTVMAHNMLGLLAWREAEHERALEHYREALAIIDEAQLDVGPLQAMLFANTGLVRRDMGDLELAEASLLRAIEVAVGPPPAPFLPMLRGHLGIVYVDTGEFDRAEPLLQEALAGHRASLGPTHPQTALSAINLGLLRQRQSRYDEARSLTLGAVEVLEQGSAGTEHLAMAVNNLGLIDYELGDYVRAEASFERALAILEEALGKMHPSLVMPLNNLSRVRLAKGDSIDAIGPLVTAQSILILAHDGPHPQRALVEANLALLWVKVGAYDLALPLVESAIADYEALGLSDHPDTAVALLISAEVMRESGDLTRAADLAGQALEIQEGALGPRHPSLAWSLNALAMIAGEKGDLAFQNETFLRAASIRESGSGADHPELAILLWNLVTGYWQVGQLDLAEQSAARALEIEERNIARVLPSASEQQARAYMDTIDTSAEAILSFQAVRPGVESTRRLALETVLRRKGRVLDVLAGGLRTLRQQLAQEDRVLVDELMQRRDALARLVLGDRVAEDDLDELRDEIEALEREAARRGGLMRAAAAPVTVASVQRALPADSALIEIVAFDAYDPTGVESSWGEAQLGAFVLRPEGEPDWFALGDAEPIEAAIRALQGALADVSTAGEALEAGSREVYDALVAPLGERLEGVERLFIAPDGPVHLVPFAALVAPGGELLVEAFEINYLTSGRDLLRPASRQSSPTASLVMGAPAFDLPGAEPAPHRVGALVGAPSFGPLPGTRQEAERVAETLGVRARTGTAASESALRSRPSPHVLHLATHGFFLPDEAKTRPDRATERGLQMVSTTQPGAPMDPFRGALAGESPLLRSGVVLAGANQQREGEEDGVLTALELAGLDLVGTQLAVLSACETGLGDVEIGEGVYGLRRALVLAGADAQLVSLWKVADDATRDLMIDYYGRRLDGMPHGAALRATQRAMIEGDRYAHPYYWSAFVPIGAGGDLARFQPALPGVVAFALGSAELDARARSRLDAFAAELAQARYADRPIRLGGHTDDLGDAASNDRLSRARAEAVRAYLVGRGIAPDRLRVEAHGEERPRVVNRDGGTRSENRRVEVVIAPD